MRGNSREIRITFETMKKPELLAPAGNMEKLKIAIHYGADAVYLGGKSFGLRNLADNFTTSELMEAVAYSHDRQVKVYLTVNSYPDNSELPSIRHFLDEVSGIPFDACIVADPGVIDIIREVSPERAIHLSTQANTTNWRSAMFWQKQGIKRINLAREMSLDAMREVRGKVKIELEAFVHGAMCISYSGRCLLSSVMANRSANRGECAHPCRWSYSLVEETRPGEYFPVMEDGTGTFIFNSKDLCLLQYLPELAGSGINSLKIEGRMKGINYCASVVRVYREALDRFFDDPVNYRCRPEWLEELCKISHRGYTTGFFLGPPRDIDHEYHSRYKRSHDIVGIVEESSSDGTTVIGVKNRLETGDTLEFISRGMEINPHLLVEMDGDKGESLKVAHPNQRIMVKVTFNTAVFDLVRREKK
jgi:putative protease